LLLLGSLMLKRSLFFMTLFGLAIAVYRNGLSIPYYNDDCQRVFTNPREVVFQGFTASNPQDTFYRPLEQVLLAIIQIGWGWNTFPIRILHLLFHTAIAMLVFHALRTWKVHLVSALVASMFVIVSQLSALTVLSNNTLSQLMGAFFSSLSVWMLYRYSVEGTQWKFFFSIVLFSLAILSKETSAGLPLAIALLIARQRKKGLVDFKQIFILLLPYAVCSLIYLILRVHAGGSIPEFGSTQMYGFRLGSNVLKNVRLYMGEAILPSSTVTVLQAAYYNNYLLIICLSVYTAIFLGIAGYGVWKSPRKPVVKMICIGILCSWLPAILLNHISELYIYNSVFYLALLFGISVEYYWTKDPLRSPRTIFASCTIFLAVGITNMTGVDEKALLMKKEGDCAAILLPQIISLTTQIPENDYLYLVKQSEPGLEYSKFLTPSFGVLYSADTLVRYYAHKPHSHYIIGDSATCSQNAQIHAGIAFTCDLKTFRVYPITPNFAAQK
jgi:hypothetical protein